MELKDLIINYMSQEISKILTEIPNEFFEKIQEIRLRVDKPLIILADSKEYYLDGEGNFTDDICKGYSPTCADISRIIEIISNYSLYAFADEIKNGYLTIPGGHRIGLSGKVVVEGDKIKTIKYINGINIRISHEIKDCARVIIPYIVRDGKVLHTMIISPPGCGKTTLLRDTIRLLSNGIENVIRGQGVGVCDERSELAGCYEGVAQNDLGLRTDVLDGCPKAEGMLMLLRSMGPKVIAVDEIGKTNEITAIEHIVNAGVVLLCTVHGSNLDDLNNKPVLRELISRKIIQRFVFLKNNGVVAQILDENFNDILNIQT